MINEIQPTGGQYPTDRVLKVGAGADQTTPAPGAAEKGDRVEISDLAYWRAKIAALPSVRAEKIAAVREQIEDGSYETYEKLDIAVDALLRDVTADDT